jgi:hypothetical protein
LQRQRILKPQEVRLQRQRVERTRAGGRQVQILESNARLVRVVNPDAMRGRGRILRQAAIVEVAKVREILLAEQGEGTGAGAPVASKQVASKQAGACALVTQIELE